MLNNRNSYSRTFRRESYIYISFSGSAGPDGASALFILIPAILCNNISPPSLWYCVWLLCVIEGDRRVSRVCLCQCRCFVLAPQAPTLTMEGGRLKRCLQLLPGRDFETVPEPVWRALYHWYGANISLPRPVSEQSTAVQHIIHLYTF